MKELRKLIVVSMALFAGFGCFACSPFTTKPVPGPDKQAVGTWAGAAAGAGAGAVTGAQLTSAAGPGAWVGAGFGAVFGLFSGLGVDLLEEDQINRQMQQDELRELSWVHEVLAEHYARRLELHPNRDIYPADWFFDSDSIEVKEDSKRLVQEIAKITRNRMPWSRIVIAVYNTSEDPNAAYSQHLTKRRAEELAVMFVGVGMEPRRILTQAVTISEPILIDPDDTHGRYRQAVEIIALDR